MFDLMLSRYLETQRNKWPECLFNHLKQNIRVLDGRGEHVGVSPLPIGEVPCKERVVPCAQLPAAHVPN